MEMFVVCQKLFKSIMADLRFFFLFTFDGIKSKQNQLGHVYCYSYFSSFEARSWHHYSVEEFPSQPFCLRWMLHIWLNWIDSPLKIHDLEGHFCYFNYKLHTFRETFRYEFARREALETFSVVFLQKQRHFFHQRRFHRQICHWLKSSRHGKGEGMN